MANPALKNGYFSIANELAERFAMVNIPGNEMRIIWVVWRQTWGYLANNRRKDWDWISLSQFEKKTGMNRAGVCSCIKSLVSKRILLKKDNLLKFNQNYEDWGVSKRILGVSKRILGGMQEDTKGSMQEDTHKRKKENITKETLVKIGASPAILTAVGNSSGTKPLKKMVEKMGEDEFDKFHKMYPRRDGGVQKPKSLFLKLEKSLLPTILAHVEMMSRSEQWKNPKLIPMQQTYIFQKRWEGIPIGPKSLEEKATAFRSSYRGDSDQVYFQFLAENLLEIRKLNKNEKEEIARICYGYSKK